MTSYDHDAVLNAALAALQKGKLSEALRHAELATENKPGDAEGWSILGLAMGNRDGLPHLRKATEMEPQEPRWLIHFGNGLTAAGEYEAAQDAFAMAVKLSRGNPHVMEMWGDSLFRLEMFREAASVFKRVLQAQPSAQVWIKAGDALIGANDTINGVKAYERAYLPEDRPFDVSAKLADLHFLLNQYDTAEVFIEDMLKAQPDNPDAGLRLANLYRWRGDHGKALQVQQQFWHLNPGHAGLIAALLDDGDDSVMDTGVSIVKDTSQDVSDRRRVSFALARFHDRHRNEKDAWAYAEQANTLYNDGLSYDGAAEHKRQLELALGAYAQLPDSHSSQPSMIYVAGPPRCGGSLLQTILSAADGVVSVGERGALLSWVLPKLDDVASLKKLLPELSGPDFAGMAKAAGAANVYVDKTSPHIIILGLLAKIHGGSQFVVPSRNRDDMIVSMYFHDFPPQFAYTRTVAGIKAYLDFQEIAISAWRAAGLKIIEHDHDSFVKDPGIHGRTLFDALGLQWSDDVLETSQSDSVVRTFSARQVRSGVSKKFAGRGARYATFIG